MRGMEVHVPFGSTARRDGLGGGEFGGLQCIRHPSHLWTCTQQHRWWLDWCGFLVLQCFTMFHLGFTLVKHLGHALNRPLAMWIMGRKHCSSKVHLGSFGFHLGGFIVMGVSTCFNLGLAPCGQRVVDLSCRNWASPSGHWSWRFARFAQQYCGLYETYERYLYVYYILLLYYMNYVCIYIYIHIYIYIRTYIKYTYSY